MINASNPPLRLDRNAAMLLRVNGAGAMLLVVLYGDCPSQLVAGVDEQGLLVGIQIHADAS